MRRKARFSFGKRNGSRSGYTEFRYGGQKPVNLAGPAPVRTKPILKGASRQTLIDQTIETMADWRKTPFEHEGAARAGLRAGLVLKGNSWHQSDAQAAEVVEEALNTLGARRPSLEEAQAGYALAGDFCSWCFCAIDEEDRSRGRKFCSKHCAKVALEYMARKNARHYGTVLMSAIRLIKAEEAPPQTCQHCERTFQADREQRFCSLSCSASFRHADHALHPIRCGICDVTFKPWSHRQRYCSRSCGQLANRQKEAEQLSDVTRRCGLCDASFNPRVRNGKYCSEKCKTTASSRAHKLRNKAATPPLAHCSWCGDEYQPKIALRTGALNHCSDKCGADRSRVALGANLRKLTRRTFDHYLALPVDEEWRRRLTPQKLDWFFMESGKTITGTAAMPRVTDALFGEVRTS